MSFITNIITQLLGFLYSLTGNNFGLAIILLTIAIRGVMIPVTLPSLRSVKKMQELKPLLDKIKKKHKDKSKLQKAQLELYKQHGVNPAAGCLPQIVQLVVLIALYRVFMDFINNGQDINMNFLWLDLSRPDSYHILPFLAGFTQLIFSFMMRPGLEHHNTKSKKKAKKKQAESQTEMAESIQQQMLYMMPLMTVIIALRFPSGLALYWVVTTLFSLTQQYIISGPGGLVVIKHKFLPSLTKFLPNQNIK